MRADSLDAKPSDGIDAATPAVAGMPVVSAITIAEIDCAKKT